MKLNERRQVSIRNGFHRTLLRDEENKRKLFKDVDTFDDLYERRSDDKIIHENHETTKKILRKTKKIEILDYSIENCFKVIDDNLRAIYNKIKNFIMSYQDLNYLFSCNEEIFLYEDQELIELTIKSEYIIISVLQSNRKINYYINNINDADKMIDELVKQFDEQGFIKLESYVNIDYLLNYPHCENCVIMNEEIIDNPPFKEILKK